MEERKKILSVRCDQKKFAECRSYERERHLVPCSGVWSLSTLRPPLWKRKWRRGKSGGSRVSELCGSRVGQSLDVQQFRLFVSLVPFRIRGQRSAPVIGCHCSAPCAPPPRCVLTSCCLCSQAAGSEEGEVT